MYPKTNTDKNVLLKNYSNMRKSLSGKWKKSSHQISINNEIQISIRCTVFWIRQVIDWGLVVDQLPQEAEEDEVLVGDHLN